MAHRFNRHEVARGMGKHHQVVEIGAERAAQTIVLQLRNTAPSIETMVHVQCRARRLQAQHRQAVRRQLVRTHLPAPGCGKRDTATRTFGEVGMPTQPHGRSVPGAVGQHQVQLQRVCVQLQGLPAIKGKRPSAVAGMLQA